MPATFIQTPHSPYYAELAAATQTNLDYLIDRFQPEGCWSPTWAWGGYEAAWEQARRHWQGVLTLQTLRILQAFNRIEA